MKKVITILLILLSSKAFSQTPLHSLLGKDGVATIPCVNTGYLLDTFTNAAVAYSLRRLRSAYSGSLIRVRRSSDNASIDIGCLNDTLDTPALLSFVGAGSGYINKWYDQSGNANDAVQITSANQPRIVNAGVVERINGRPAILFIASSSTVLPFSQTTVTSTANWSVYQVTKRSAAAKISPSFTSTTFPGVGPLVTQWSDNTFYIASTIGANTRYRGAADATATFILLEGYDISDNLTAYKNTTAYTLSALALDGGATPWGAIGGGSGSFADGYMCEAILYSSDKSATQAGIRNNINLFYSIY